MHCVTVDFVLQKKGGGGRLLISLHLPASKPRTFTRQPFHGTRIASGSMDQSWVGRRDGSEGGGRNVATCFR